MGLGYVRIPDPRGRGHRADALTLEHAMGRANPNWAAQSGSPVAERCRGGGALNVATKPILIGYAYSAHSLQYPPASSRL